MTFPLALSPSAWHYPNMMNDAVAGLSGCSPANDNDAPGTVRVKGLEMIASPTMRLTIALMANKRKGKRDPKWKEVVFNERR